MSELLVMQARACKKCSRGDLPLEEFHRNGDKYSYWCRDCRSKKDKQIRQKLKEAVFAHYGRACTCCGETELSFLAIDHINGGGTAHRRVAGRGHFYRWLRDQDFPDGYQVLCHNCNWAKSNGGCPHQLSLISLLEMEVAA